MFLRVRQPLSLACLAIFVLALPMQGAEPPAASNKPNETQPAMASRSDIEQLKAMLLEQQRQIDELRKELAAQRKDHAVFAMVPAAPPPAPSDTASKDAVQKAVNTINSNLGGFKFSGDLRFRFDLLDRAANTNLPPSDNRSTPAQRARERIRVRFNIDKDLFYSEKNDAPLAKFHLMLATDPYNNPVTMDSDFAGLGTRAPFSIAEAWVDVNPVKGVTLRAGRTKELFADDRQFVYDDDIRFNGFHETYRWNGKSNGLFFEAKAAQYILTDPNVQIVPAGSGYLAAGYKVGQRIPSAGIFDQGIAVGHNLNKKWSQNGTANYFLVREPNQIQLASTSNGAALFANNPIVGATFIGNLGGTGNATTTAGGGAYFASAFHVVRGAYNLNYAGKEWKGHNYPFTLMVQATHNTGASIQNNGYMLGAALGQAKKLGDIQFQYQYFYKPANAFVSQFSDDDVGTGSGVNLKTNQIRVNIGITRFLSWENRLYIQHGIAVNNPAINFFVPLQQGYNTQFRFHSHLAFTF